MTVPIDPCDDRSTLLPLHALEVSAELDDDWRKRELKARLFGDQHLSTRVGRFVLLGSLGRGGMGSVQRAYDETLNRQVAIKVMHRRKSKEDDKRVLREAQALARLSHPNVVQVYEVGEVDDRLFIAMELLVGETLRQWQDGAPPWRRCLDAYLQAGRGLAAAHAAGMVHRDFKPSNCIIDAEQRVRVLDFGLARTSDRRSPEQSAASTIEDLDHGAEVATDSSDRSQAPPTPRDDRLTRAGCVAGTVGYMAPEQLKGNEVDARADQFSFCVSLYEAVFGQPPFSTRPMPNLMRMAAGEHLEPAAPPPGSRAPRWLVRVLWRGLAASPAARWPSMEALLEALERPMRRRWSGLGALGAAALGLAVVGGWPSASADAPAPCSGAGDEVSGIWDEDARDKLRDAFEATELTYADDTAKRVASGLREYADELEAGYVDACEATRVRSEQTRDDLSLRNACLDEHVDAMQETVAVVEIADAQIVNTAVTLVAALPPIEACTDVEALSRAAVARGPQDQATLQKRMELRTQIARARALEVSGKLAEGLQVVRPLADRAHTLGDHSSQAEAQLVEGLLQSASGEHGRAAELLRDASQWAIEHGADSIAVETLSALIYVKGVEQARPDAALTLGAVVAEPLADRIGPRSAAKARILTAVAQVLSESGEHARARARYENAVAILAETAGDNHIDLADPLDSLGNALRHQGQLDEAYRASKRALEIRVRWLGGQHPDVAHQRIDLGAILSKQRKYDDAEGEYRKALPIVLAAGPRHRSTLAHLHTNLAATLARQERYAEAQAEFRAAAEAWEAELGPDHPRVAQVRYGLGNALVEVGDIERAADEFERAQIILEGNEANAQRDKLLNKVRRRLEAIALNHADDHEVNP